jgi:central kinetochore subunit Mis15/CHL4
LEGIPKAFSRPRERYKLESTALSARNIEELCEKRGGGRTNAVGGGWGQYAEEGKTDNPLNIHMQLPTPDPTLIEEDIVKKPEGMKRKRDDDETVVKRRKLVAQGRFGNSALPNDGKGIERLDIRLEEPCPFSSKELPLFGEITPPRPTSPGAKKKGRRSTISLELDRTEDDVEDGGEWRPDIRVTLHGPHIFAGIRKLVEAGVIGGERMPGWMTGEEGVSVGIVRDGRIKGYKGSGI